jgi:hypothetical protein
MYLRIRFFFVLTPPFVDCVSPAISSERRDVKTQSELSLFIILSAEIHGRPISLMLYYDASST